MLTPEEANQLSVLMGKVEFPVPQEVFDAWCANFTINTAELILVRLNKSGEKEIFLTYRKDKCFDGWHVPGSVILPTKTVEETLDKLVKNEFGGLEMSKPKFFNWLERVVGRDKGVRGQEIALLFYANCVGDFAESEHARFFAFDQMPPNLIEIHKGLIEILSRSDIVSLIT